MKNKLLLLFIAWNTSLGGHIHSEIKNYKTPESIARFVYGPQGLNVPVADYQKIESLLTELTLLNTDQKLHVLPALLNYLGTTVEKKEKKIKEQYSDKEKVSLLSFYNVFALKHQITYLEELQKKLSQQQGFFAWLKGIFIKNKIDQKNLINKIIEYIQYEQEHILFKYHKQLSFFTSLKKIALPDVINFWSTDSIQRQMYIRAEQVSDRVVTQFGIDTILDLAVQGVLMAGGSMSIAWVDQNDEAIFENYQKKQNQIQALWQTFITNIEQQSQNITTNILSSFKTALTTIQQNYATSNTLLQNEIQYLMRSITIAQPKQVFLEAPINYDLAFQAAPMNTPEPHTWYNIAQKGDWQYDAQSNAFWQNGLQPFGIPAWKTDPITKKQGLDVPEFNSIFTESILNGAEYDIEVECTLYTTNFPFFIGIMFNKARWISGSPERLTGYRLFGLYGDTDQKQTFTKTIDAVFAEQTIIPAQQNSKEQIISPLQIIDTEPSAHIASNIIKTKDLAVLGIEPLTFIFQITTSPEKATCTVLQKTTDTAGTVSQKQLAQKTIENLNKNSYLYHGIGFMAPGCQASFTIIKPIELVYTAEQIKAFKLLQSS